MTEMKTLSKDDVERFWSKVRKSDGCWIYTGYCNQHGYGRFLYDGKLRTASRFSYFLAHGSIPDGMCILHNCDNPPCVNPSHLFIGTVRDNSLDAGRKGKLSRNGERNSHAILNASQVLSLRADRRNGMRFKDIAAKYGVNYYHAQKIAWGLRWATLMEGEHVSANS